MEKDKKCDTDTTPLVAEKKKSTQEAYKKLAWLVMTSSFLSFALAGEFNFRIAGSLTVSMSERFNVDLNIASWSTSVHTTLFLMGSMCQFFTSKFC